MGRLTGCSKRKASLRRISHCPVKLTLSAGLLIATLTLTASPFLATDGKIDSAEKAELRQDRKEIGRHLQEIKSDCRAKRKNRKGLRSDRHGAVNN